MRLSSRDAEDKEKEFGGATQLIFGVPTVHPAFGFMHIEHS